jgi:hypothetical protein
MEVRVKVGDGSNNETGTKLRFEKATGTWYSEHPSIRTVLSYPVIPWWTPYLPYIRDVWRNSINPGMTEWRLCHHTAHAPHTFVNFLMKYKRLIYIVKVRSGGGKWRRNSGGRRDHYCGGCTSIMHTSGLHGGLRSQQSVDMLLRLAASEWLWMDQHCDRQA